MPLIQANGIRFHVVELGVGPPVVMVHGLLMGNLAMWYLTVAPPVAAKHRVLLYDLRGHGRSDRPPRGYGLPAMVGDLSALLERLAPEEPVALLGHSYGALIALRYALRRPERVARLALVEAPLEADPAPGLADLMARGPRALLAAVPEIIRRDLGNGKRRARRLLESLGQLVSDTTLLADVAEAGGVDPMELGALQCPVLAVYGRDSACRNSSESLRRSLPSARILELDGGHYLPLEVPSALAGHLLEFLDG